MTKGIFKMLLPILLVLFLWPGVALGVGYGIAGNSNGLIIESLDANEDMNNLNPGDLKNSRLRLTNAGSGSLTVYIRTEITGEETLQGGQLADVMQLTIQDGAAIITQDTFRNADSAHNIKLGTMTPGAQKMLRFKVNLPGADTGNPYQGAIMKARWVFTTVAGADGDDDPDDSNNPDPPELLELPEEPDVFVPLESGDEEITVSQGEEPRMPGTGVESPFTYYAAGSVVIIAGLLLAKKKK